MGKVATGLNFPDPNKVPLTRDEVVEALVKCGYLGSAYVSEKFGNLVLDPAKDPNIVGATGIFTDAEFNTGTDSGEFRKTASVMKMVIDGYAGAGCITMGGYDYHGGKRAGRRDEGLPRGTLHGSGSRVRGAHGPAGHDVRVQRRLALEQRRRRQLHRGARQGRVDER
jgi:hypothetical protein